MRDTYGRDIKYLRLSVTDKCNHMCFYCRNSCDSLQEDMRVEDIEEYVRALVDFGISKVRITGGEPLMRKDLPLICSTIKAIKGVEELCLTTNGSLLFENAKALKDSGVDRVNISLNTLNRAKFNRITPIGSFDSVIKGLERVQELGYVNTKINTVLMKSINDDEIDCFVDFIKKEDVTIRFIEYMPIGEARKNFEKYYISSNIILQNHPELSKIKDDGVSQIYTSEGYRGRIGLINPVSDKFCSHCNRMRLTSDYKLRSCLHSDKYFYIKNLHGDELRDTIKKAIECKPQSHKFATNEFASTAMNKIGG